MRIGEKDTTVLLNTNIKVFGKIPKTITIYEITKLFTHVREKIKLYHPNLEYLLNKLFLGLDIDQRIGCWISKDWSHYRTVNIDGKQLRAHRLSYELFINNLNDFACHHCDRKGCMNAWHLFDGTASENTIDSQLKGRAHYGLKGLTQTEKFLLNRHLNNVGKVIEVNPLCKIDEVQWNCELDKIDYSKWLKDDN